MRTRTWEFLCAYAAHSDLEAKIYLLLLYRPWVSWSLCTVNHANDECKSLLQCCMLILLVIYVPDAQKWLVDVLNPSTSQLLNQIRDVDER